MAVYCSASLSSEDLSAAAIVLLPSSRSQHPLHPSPTIIALATPPLSRTFPQSGSAASEKERQVPNLLSSHQPGVVYLADHPLLLSLFLQLHHVSPLSLF
ncbi:unnamed protein product [Gadus morhua 'NCC']